MIALVLSVFAVNALSPPQGKSIDEPIGYEIKVNQLGFYPDSPKIAIVPGRPEGKFQVIHTGTDDVVYEGELSAPAFWAYSGETVSRADFTELTRPGRYRVIHQTAGRSFEFEIRNEVFRSLSKAAIKAFYFNRASTALEETHAGMWARPMGHPDEVVYIHSSAATGERPAGSEIPSPRGWYDAGDYNKYAVNSGISTFTLLAAYEHFPEYYRNLRLNIPESDNGVPDILDEARWNLDWLLSIQDPNDGGVYHKVTSLDFSGVVMPHEDNADRYAVMKSTSGTLNFAAVMATAARVFRAYDPEFSKRCLAAAEFAWKWAQANPDVYYEQPQDVHTGAYRDRSVDDEFDWAAGELYITTGNGEYWDAGGFEETGAGVPSWSYVRPLAWISLAHHRERLTNDANPSLISQRIIEQADRLIEESVRSAYGVSLGRYGNRDFVWGSNGVIGNHALMLVQAYRLSGNDVYLNAALANLDYLLGRNATGYSFVTGYGTRTPRFPHHRQSAADDNEMPVPGFVVGGPHAGQQDNCDYPSDLPAKSYLDHWCSYSTNEVAINWNAPLVYLTGALEYYSNTSSESETAEWESLFDGRSLGNWQPTEFLLPGTVSIEDGAILIGRGDGLTGITWTGEEPLPRNNYEIALEASRLSGIDFFCGLTFPVNASYVSFIVGGWGGNVVGISSIDSVDASENETTTYMSFETNRWYSIRVRVGGDRIQTWIDNEPVVDIDTGDRRLDIRPDVSLSRPLGIASWNTAAALRNIRIRRLDQAADVY